MSRADAVALADLVGLVAFIVGLMRLSSPATARSGNAVAAGGMAVVIAATLAGGGIAGAWQIALALVAGGAAGAISARAVRMTAMPQMVALFNGLGGGAAALIAAAEYRHTAGGRTSAEMAAILFSLVVGSVSFGGSLLAFAKLQELVAVRPVVYRGQTVLNGALAVAVLAMCAWVAAVGGDTEVAVLAVLAVALGALFVLPIGGADMPVVISLLNACTGLAAAATGFALHNDALIVAGTLVGASGMVLTRMMGRAMNRSLANVLFGAFGSAPAGGGAPAGGERAVRELPAADVALLLAYANRVVIVPGYGLAVARGQHVVHELADLLEDRGVDVRFAIHPVAGRMPGHMNVLLAEADVPYTELADLETINPEFPETDVVLVVGANDVVNPGARTDPQSPVFGMPILDVDRARQVIVLKRSLRPGFAGVDNPLFYEDNCALLFGDARESLAALVQELKQLEPEPAGPGRAGASRAA